MRSTAWCFFLVALTTHANGTPRLAVFGDRYATGAAASSQYQLDFTTVWQQLEAPPTQTISPADLQLLAIQGFQPPFAAPRTLWFSQQEFLTGLDWSVKYLVQGLSQLYYNQDALSWGALLGKRLGLSASDVLLAAHMGDSMAQFPMQVERMLTATSGEVPERVLVWFPIEDLCHASLSAPSPQHQYRTALKQGLERFASARPAPSGSQIWVLSPHKATQLLLSPTIQAKSVHAFGATTTCKQLRDTNFHPGSLPALDKAPPVAAYLADLIPPSPARMCPSFFAQKLLAQQEVSLFASETKRKRDVELKVEAATGNLSQAIRNYREAGKKEVETMQATWEKKHSSLTVHWVAATEALELEAEDLAGDCFHLSLAGHLKVVKLVEAAIR